MSVRNEPTQASASVFYGMQLVALVFLALQSWKSLRKKVSNLSFLRRLYLDFSRYQTIVRGTSETIDAPLLLTVRWVLLVVSEYGKNCEHGATCMSRYEALWFTICKKASIACGQEPRKNKSTGLRKNFKKKQRKNT